LIAGIGGGDTEQLNEFYPNSEQDNQDRRLFVLDDNAEYRAIFWCPNLASSFETRRQLVTMVDARVVAYAAAKRLEIAERSFMHRRGHRSDTSCGACESRLEELDRRYPRIRT
jgi:hypothetical protein